VLPDRPAGFIDQGETVYVGVDRQPDGRAAIPHQLSKFTEVFRDRLGCPREEAVGLQIDSGRPAAKPIQERGPGNSTRPPDAIQSNMKAALLDRRDIDHRQAEDGIEVALDRMPILAHLPQILPPVPWWTLLRQRPHPRPRLRVEKDAVGTHELERVP